MNKATVNHWLCNSPIDIASIFIIPEKLPRTKLLDYALQSGKLEIECDYSGFVNLDMPGFFYRLTMNERLSVADFA